MNEVVQICPTPFPFLGGPAVNFTQFQSALDSSAICFNRPGEGEMGDCVVDVSAWMTASNLPLLWKYYYPLNGGQRGKAEELIARAKCVVVHSFFRYPGLWAQRTCQRYGIPYIVVLHGSLDPYALRKNRIIKWIWLQFWGKAFLRKARFVVFSTNLEYQKAREFIRPDQARIVHWASAGKLPQDMPEQRVRLRAACSFRPTDRVLVFFGRLHSMKRPLETVRAVAACNDPRLKLLVVGPDADVSAQMLEREARKLNWDGLRVIGPVFNDDKFRWLAAADAYISLSHRENFNFTAVEAMRCGLPVILSPGNDLGWEFIHQGFSWQLERPGVHDEIKAIREFAGMADEKLATMGRKACAWASANLSFERFSREINSVIRDASL